MKEELKEMLIQMHEEAKENLMDYIEGQGEGEGITDINEFEEAFNQEQDLYYVRFYDLGCLYTIRALLNKLQEYETI